MIQVRMKLIILIILKFFLISALFIVSNENLHLNDNIKRRKFLDIYSTWLGRIFYQTQGIIDSTLSLKWLPQNNISQG